jgi:hypothetical protein
MSIGVEWQIAAREIQESAFTYAHTVRTWQPLVDRAGLAASDKITIPRTVQQVDRCKRGTSRGRRSQYPRIEEALREIADAHPCSYAEVFGQLQERATEFPRAHPFKVAGGWRAGHKKDPRSANVWLAKIWRKLGLPRHFGR